MVAIDGQNVRQSEEDGTADAHRSKDSAKERENEESLAFARSIKQNSTYEANSFKYHARGERRGEDGCS